jgi:hypothetical protein
MAAIIREDRQDIGGGEEQLTLWVRWGVWEQDQFAFYSDRGPTPVPLPTPAIVKAQMGDELDTLAAGLDYGWNRAQAIEYALVQDGNAGDPGYLTQLRADMVILLNILRA